MDPDKLSEEDAQQAEQGQIDECARGLAERLLKMLQFVVLHIGFSILRVANLTALKLFVGFHVGTPFLWSFQESEEKYNVLYLVAARTW